MGTVSQIANHLKLELDCKIC